MVKYFTLATINPSKDTIIYNNAIQRSVKAGVISIIPNCSNKLLLNLLNGEKMEITLSITPLELNEKLVNSLEKLILNQMIRLVRGHFLSNGNKRLGIISCGAFLASVGLYLKWNNNKVQYLNNWEKIMIQIAEGKIAKDIDEIKAKLNLTKIFEESIYLSIKWIEV